MFVSCPHLSLPFDLLHRLNNREHVAKRLLVIDTALNHVADARVAGHGDDVRVGPGAQGVFGVAQQQRRGQRGGGDEGGAVHAGAVRKDRWIHREDIGHGREGGQTGDNLALATQLQPITTLQKQPLLDIKIQNLWFSLVCSH